MALLAGSKRNLGFHSHQSDVERFLGIGVVKDKLDTRHQQKEIQVPSYLLYDKGGGSCEVEWTRPPFAHPCRAACDEYNAKEDARAPPTPPPKARPSSAPALRRRNSALPSPSRPGSATRGPARHVLRLPGEKLAGLSGSDGSERGSRLSRSSSLSAMLRQAVQRAVATEVQRVVQPLQEELQRERLTRQRLAMSLTTL
ncbi:unnamed protein product [Effrenium voratum]|nr:unnamed protein product [Effrenium voratum]